MFDRKLGDDLENIGDFQSRIMSLVLIFYRRMGNDLETIGDFQKRKISVVLFFWKNGGDLETNDDLHGRKIEFGKNKHFDFFRAARAFS